MIRKNFFILFILSVLLTTSVFSLTFVPPKIVHPAQEDQNFNLIVDRLEKEMAKAKAEGKETEPVRIEVVLYEPYTQEDLATFEKLGGKIIHTFEYVSYGYAGTIPYNKIEELKKLLNENGKLCIISDDPKGGAFLDYSAQLVRARNAYVWGAGYEGESTTTIAVLDTGIDDSHTDFFGRVSAGWTDTTSDAYATARDYNGHGSHCSGIALGSVAALGSGSITSITVTDTGFMHPTGGYGWITMNEVKSTGTSAITINLQWSWGTCWLNCEDPSWTWLGGGGSASSPYSRSYDAIVTGTFKPYIGNSSGAANAPYSCLITHNYSDVSDSYNLFRGIAPGCKLLGVKVLLNNGSGNSTDWGEGLDWCVTNRATYNIRVINMSLGLFTGSTDSTLDTKVNTAVSNGIVVCCAAGNDYPTYTIPSPGNAAKAITVGAINDKAAMTNYSSNGFGGQNKPDVVAPGGSNVANTLITSVETNDGDAQNNLTDRQSNDYTNMKGTSMATPMVAGLAGLVIDAKGSWGYTESEVLSVKNVILMTATETNIIGEYNWNGGSTPTVLSGNDPTLDRGARDLREGFGKVNADAAVEAVVYNLPLYTGSIPRTIGSGVTDRKAMAVSVSMTNGVQYDIDLQNIGGTPLDCDLYLYSGTPDANGNPVILASATNSGTADEQIIYTAASTGTNYLVGKYVTVSGSGSYSFGYATSVSDWVLY